MCGRDICASRLAAGPGGLPVTRLAGLVRGLLHRGGSTVMIFVAALVASAAAATGPAYYAAAKTSILRDTVTSTSYLGRGFEATQTGAVKELINPLLAQVRWQLGRNLGGQAAVRRLFAPPVEALQANAVDVPLNATIPLVWRTGFCAQLKIRGTCPTQRGQVVISSSLSGALAVHHRWQIGQRVRLPGWGTLTVTGVYTPPDVSRDYWFGNGPAYFPREHPPGRVFPPPPGLDAMFTARATMTSAPLTMQGTGTLDNLLIPAHLPASEVPRLLAAMNELMNNVRLNAQQVIITSEVPATLGTVESGWNAIAVPVLLITAQLLVPVWLLLFLAVRDAAEARGPEVALAKLRGYGPWRSIVFGLSDPVLLLVLALPAGVVTGWAATSALGRVLLRPGTPVGLPPLAWAAAAAATAGGLTAVLIAAWRTVRRPVVEQWRHTGRRAADRGWILDAILVTGAAAGLLELAVSGHITSAHRSVLGLLVPGLIGLAVAVVASRLLPVGCRALFRRTGRGGGVGGFLAVRHIARRPDGIRTTMVLGTAFALAGFALAAWSVNRANDRLIAGTEVGAPTVLTVSLPPGRDLGAVVNHVDPGGHLAADVDRFTSLASSSAGLSVLGVQPRRFARVAYWSRSFTAAPLRSLAAALAPPAPPPVTLTGDAVRVTVRVRSLAPGRAGLAADVVAPTGTGITPVSLGTLPVRGTATLTGQLPGCPCTLHDLSVNLLPGLPPPLVAGNLVFTRLQVHRSSGWVTVDTGFADASRWRPGTVDHPADVLSASASGLAWRFVTPGRQSPALNSVNRPAVLPAIVAAPLTGGRRGIFTAVGLDGGPLEVHPVAVAAAVPAAAASGIIVDRRFAELAANGNLSQVTQQVWVAAGASAVIERRLAAAGVEVLAVQHARTLAAQLGRQGPGLASVLFLADAAAAAVLAAGGAVLGLYLSARRRRYEYAALAASGVPRRTLHRALLAEQAAVLGFGTAVGIAAGLAAAVLVLPDIPEFAGQPLAVPLSYTPSAGQLAVLLGAAAALLLAAAVIASATLIHGVRLSQLREAPA
jgi:putative ABC transport system permease protein